MRAPFYAAAEREASAVIGSVVDVAWRCLGRVAVYSGEAEPGWSRFLITALYIRDRGY
jgi:hypothetical protein